MHDEFDLSRFINAQHPIYDRGIGELRAGRKTSHWMRFIFPQLQGLGRSEMAKRFAISDADEAHAYLGHELLRMRLEDCVSALLNHQDKTAHQIFGSPDDLKLRSCLTLFAAVTSDSAVFRKALDQFFDGKPDGSTKDLLSRPPQRPEP